MATPQRQIALDSQDARTPMNGEPTTELIQLIARSASLSSDADLAAGHRVDQSEGEAASESAVCCGPDGGRGVASLARA